MLRYLADGAAVYQTTDHATDRLDPTRRFGVPGGYRTDGLWIWRRQSPTTFASTRSHRIRGLGHRIAGHGYRCPPVTAQTVERARAALAACARIIEERVAAYRSGELAAPPRTWRTGSRRT